MTSSQIKQKLLERLDQLSEEEQRKILEYAQNLPSAPKGTPGKELLETAVIKGVVGRQPPNPREAADIDRKSALDWRRDWLGDHRRLLSQTAERGVKARGAESVT